MIRLPSKSFPRAHSSIAGAAYVILLVTLSAILFLAFSVIQLTYGISRSLQTTYVALNTIQKMQGSIPYEESAYRSAAWVAALNGFEGARPVPNPQTVSHNKRVEFTYEDRPNPQADRVSAEYSEPVSLLAGLFHGVAQATGLVQLDARALLRGTASAPLLEIAADVSWSMVGPRDPVDSHVPIWSLLENFNIPADQDRTQAPNEFCYPIQSHYSAAELSALRLQYSILNNSDTAVTERELCELYRSQLPGYYASFRAMPYQIIYTRRPSLYNPGTVSKIPLQNYGNPNTPVPLLCGSELGVSPNPIVQLLNAPGLRLVPMMSTTAMGTPCGNGVACGSYTTATSTILSPTPNPDSPVGFFNFDDLCITPWRISNGPNTDRTWTTAEEASWCPNAPINLPPEIGAAGCGSQLMTLNHAYGDFYTTFNRLTQAFLIGASDLVPILRFGVFAGVTGDKGSVRLASQTERNPDPEISPSGHVLLFDGLSTASHLFDTSVPLAPLTKRRYARLDGTEFEVRTLLGEAYNIGDLRLSHMLAYLDPDIYPNLNRQYGSAPVPPSEHAFRGSQAYFPLDHEDFITSATRPGRSGTFTLNPYPLTGHPAEGIFGPFFRLSYMWRMVGDIADPTANQFFPSPAHMRQVILPNGQPLMTHQFYKGSGPNSSYTGRYALQQLKEVGSNGRLLSPTQDYVPETNIRNTAPAIFNYVRPAGGGTDTWGAMYSIQHGCTLHKRVAGPDAKCIGVIITDGAPEASCISNDPELPCAPLDSAEHRAKVQEQATQFEALGNTTLVVLFLQQGPPTQDVLDFIAMFQPGSPAAVNPNPKGRLLVTFPVGTPAQFAARYRDGLKLLSAIIRSLTRLTR